MNTTQIETAINQYLEALQDDYALMISGIWGVGKTTLVQLVLDKTDHNPIRHLHPVQYAPRKL